MNIEFSVDTVPFNDLNVQWRAIQASASADFEDVFAQSTFCLGPHTEAFERDLAQWLGCRHVIGVNSGTSALHLAAVVAGLGPGTEVLVPAHTFIATLWGALYAGAVPVLCDVDSDTGTIDVDDAARRLTSRTKAIIPVHLYGQAANMARVMALAEQHGLTVIEDAAQSIGATFQGQMTGTIALLGALSFYPGKNLGAAGEAGAVTTNDDAIAERLRSLRNHGQTERYIHREIGFNYRMDGLQAVVLRHKLRLQHRWIQERRRLAEVYLRQLAGLSLELPQVKHGEHVWHLFVIRTPSRDRLREFLSKQRIETGLHYPVPLNRQPCLSHLQILGGGFPNADRWADECLSLPLFVGMTDIQQQRVVETIIKFFSHA